MNTVRLAGIVTVVGSLIFCVAAFMPVSWVYAEPDVGRKLEMVRSSPRGWVLSHGLFSLGATVAAVGMGMLSARLRPPAARVLGLLGTASLLVAAAVWDWHLYLRAANPQQFVAGLIPSWLFQAYTVLTSIGLMAVGAALLLAAFPLWIGGALIALPLAFLWAFLVFGDLPPFSYYIVLLVVGAGVARREGATHSAAGNR